MTDTNGNTLYRQGNIIKLKLAVEPHPRKLGIIDEENKILTVERDSKKHLFLKNNSYGFNHGLLNTATKFTDVLIIIDRIKKYFVPVHVILEKGSFLNFKQQGFEVQIFLQFSIIEQYGK